MSAIDLAIVAAGALPVILSRDLRNARAALFLVVVGGVELLASALPQPGQFVAKAVAIWSYVIVLLWFQHLLAGRSAAEARFDRALRGIVRDAGRRAGDAGAAPAARDAYRSSIMARLTALEPPTPGWARVTSLVEAYVREELTDRLSTPDGPSPGESSAHDLDLLRRDLEAAWEEALRPGKSVPG